MSADLSLFACWRSRLLCPHLRWVEGGLTNFLTGRREYICAACGKRIERSMPPVDYIEGGR
jgi:hypothetical protein